MSFLPSAGYGNMFGYTAANAVADGLQPSHISGSIMRQAFGELVFTRFLTQSVDAFGVGKGGTFTIPIFRDWGAPTSVSALTSGTAMTVGSQVVDSVTMSMAEYGTGIAYERILDWWTNVGVRDQLTVTLGNHIGRMINWLDYDIFAKSAHYINIASPGSISTLLWNGAATHSGNAGTDYGELGMGALALLYDTLKLSLVTPITGGGLYGIVGHPQTFRHLKAGSVFQNIGYFQDLNSMKMQVLGEFMGFVFFETPELCARGTSWAFGANVGGYGFGLPPQTFFYADYGQDAGRLPVWKTIFYRGQGAIWRNKGTAAIRVNSRYGNYNYAALG